ncbi:hypothetical protein SESBI_45304 [Sesbania bispinosa]|nr:hypothetical protein SESBI_45304 [Sesbania bispinosa]
MVGSSSKRLRNGKSKKVSAKNTKKPSSGSKNTTMEGSTQQSSKKARPIVEPRFMDLDFFYSNGFEFPNLIEYQGLKHFVSIECKYLVELVKIFYSNLTIASEDLLSEVKNVKIRVRPSDWLAIAGLKYEGEKFDTTKIRTWENYNRTKAVRCMIRPGLQIPKKLNASSLRVENRLLHYTYARILIPRGSNYTQMSEEDIFVLWAIKKPHIA